MLPNTLDAYDFVVPPVIRFGPGRIVELGEVVALLGKRAWLVGSDRGLRQSTAKGQIEKSLSQAGIPWQIVATSCGEPTVDQVAAALAALPGDHSGVVVVAVGGGSAIDLAKAVAAMATNLPANTSGQDIDYDTAISDHLEGVGRCLAIQQWPLPLVAVPTTAGTGAEATRNAVISCPRRRLKKSMRSWMMVPRAAIVDPQLTVSCDRATTAATGLDCITQLIESFICRFKRPLPRALALDGLVQAVRALPRVLRDPTDLEARGAMSHAALLSGMALANAGLGMAHGVAAALGVECGTPHGVACALMLPVTIRVNSPVASADFAMLERSIDPAASTDDGVAAAALLTRIQRLCLEAGVPQRLSAVGLRPERLDWLAENSGGSSLRGNPVEIDSASLREILAAIY